MFRGGQAGLLGALPALFILLSIGVRRGPEGPAAQPRAVLHGNGCVKQEPGAGDLEVTHYSLTLTGTVDPPVLGFLSML